MSPRYCGTGHGILGCHGKIASILHAKDWLITACLDAGFCDEFSIIVYAFDFQCV